MVYAVTSNIKVEVEVFYHAAKSKENNNLFSYKVIIHNMSPYPVRLMRRHWFIFDSCGEKREVLGEGVVGEQPYLAAGNMHQYSSFCNLKTDFGSMKGYYIMQREIDGTEFEVNIPEFLLEVPSKLN
jgi:ApaG protein